MVRVKHQENSPRNCNNNDIKSQLALETYNLYKSFQKPCIHQIRHCKSSFIDWYLILRVGEDASIDTIRKQYHKFALLLHPDKNKHPKAEFAFKLISQAYKCLSDDAKRASFNLERWKKQCSECSRTPGFSSVSPLPRTTHYSQDDTGSRKSSRTSSNVAQQHLRDLREQLKEEARVIERCIRINRSSKDEYLVFDPASYAHLGYPHYRRTPHLSHPKQKVALNYEQRRGRCEQPIFQLRTDCNKLKPSSACVSS